MKETATELEASGLTWAQVQRAVTDHARKWYLARLATPATRPTPTRPPGRSTARRSSPPLTNCDANGENCRRAPINPDGTTGGFSAVGAGTTVARSYPSSLVLGNYFYLIVGNDLASIERATLQ